MAGHNKWSKIKRQKAKEDQKKGKIFGKLVREITMAAREGGGDPEYNPRLRLAIDKAKEAEMPQDNIDKAIKRGTGELEGVDYKDVVYEAYGPGGVAMVILTATDNPNRTVQDVRHALSKHGGNLGTDGSVAWQFERKGQIYVDRTRYTEDVVFEAALEAGAEDVTPMDEDEIVVTTGVKDFHEVQQAMKEAGVETSDAELAWLPNTTVPVDESAGRTLVRLLDDLNDLDDVQDVYANADVEHDIVAETA
ncbi:MAG: YebC/PmpR family DNA-binding transcriptional regulator [Longimicrobiales bacterium]|nr:YebC/PmpR family DNA-binding transcriptional regulator [Longimicrobiales bacterium]